MAASVVNESLRDWKGWQVSPHLLPWQRRALIALRQRLRRESSRTWILSSGTQSVGSVKAIGLTEEALMTAATGANEHLDCERGDRWLIAIPEYHIGGLAISVRAHLSGARISRLHGKWSASAFARGVESTRATLTSLVPTQVYDLVEAGLKSPSCLRAIVVGGGHLTEPLYRRARALGWPVLPSYGLTECGSQVATAPLVSLEGESYPTLCPLGHVRLRVDNQKLFIRSVGLCDRVATLNREGVFTLEDPRRGGELPTQDLAEEVTRGRWRILGRQDSVVKILGVLVPVLEVESAVAEFFVASGWTEPFGVIAVQDAREGSRLVLVTDSPARLPLWAHWLSRYNAQAVGPRRVTGFAWMRQLPRTELQKLRVGELRGFF